MIGKYEIMQDGKAVGTMEVTCEGLYYRFCGKCDFVTSQLFRIWVYCGVRKANLGVPVPLCDRFEIDTRRPIKLFSDETPTFLLLSEGEKHGNWVQVDENTPFPKLEDFEKGVFENRDGLAGILFTDSTQGQQDNDPNP